MRLRHLGLVFLGGGAGTAAREGLSLALANGAAFPAVIWSINVLGAFLLGLLLEWLARTGQESGRTMRLLLGTGFLGGFTTYSALATDTALLLTRGDWGTGAVYAASTVVLGAAASFLGVALAARLRRGRPHPVSHGSKP